MIASRRSTAALALLAALALCALVAQGARAVSGFEPSRYTTAFTCVEGGGSKDFSDPHCDHNVTAGTGGYGHKAISAGETTEIEVEGTGTSTLTGHPAGIEIKITATESQGTGWIENSLVETEEGKVIDHRITGHLSAEYKGLSFDGLSGCSVKEPVLVSADLESVEDPEAEAMGIEFSPAEEVGAFTEITIEGCVLAGTYPVNGSAVATGAGEGASSGATLNFIPNPKVGEIVHQELKFFGSSNTSLEATATVKKKGGNPISATTVTGGGPPTEGITAFTCAKAGGAEDFADPHCDESVKAGSGEYGHEAIAKNESREIEITNAETENETTDSADAVFELSVAGVEAKVTATKVRGSGQLENLEPKSGTHEVEGEATIRYSNLHVDKPSGCEVAEPIEAELALEGVEEGESLGLELAPKEGRTFASISFEGEECSLADLTAHVTGSALATGGRGEGADSTGATSVLEAAHESLSLGKGAVTLASTTTLKTTAGDPLSLTRIE